MESKRLSKHRSLVVQLLCGGAFAAALGLGLASLYGPTADAQTTPGTAAPVAAVAVSDVYTKACIDAVKAKYPVPTPEQLRTCGPAGSNTDPCEAAVAKIGTAADNLSKVCSGKTRGECVEKMNKCKNQDDNISSDDLDGDPDSPNVSDPCRAIKDINVDCKEVNAGNPRDYRESKKDAQQNLDDAQKKLLDAQKSQQTALDNMKQKIADLQLDIQKQTLGLENTQKKITEALNDLFAKENATAAKAATDLAAKLAQLDADQLALNTERNNAVSAISAANDAKLSKCREYAQTAYDNDRKELDAKIKARDSVVRNLGSATAMASYVPSKAKQDAAQRDQSYSGHYTACLKGVEGGGEALTAGIRAAERALTVLIGTQADKVTSINSQRAIATKQLSDLTGAMSEEKKNAITKSQNDLDTAQKATALQIAKDNSDIVTLTQQMSQAQSTGLQEIQMAQQSIANASAESQNASLRSSCFEKYGVSEAKGKTSDENWGKVDSSLQSLAQGCDSFKTSACAGMTPATCSLYKPARTPAPRTRTGTSDTAP